MTIEINIEDGLGSERTAAVTPRNALLVQTVPVSSVAGIPADTLTAVRLQRKYFLNGGSEAMNVDGSTTSVDFVITAESDLVNWITGFRILMEGTNLEIDTQDFRRFGQATSANTALTNGIDIFVEQSGVRVDIAVEPIGVLGDFLSYADEFTNLANSVSNTSDFISFDFKLDQPVVLPDGSLDRMVIRINDDLTNIDKFVAIGRGYKESTLI